jgi:hypothetical protein
MVRNRIDPLEWLRKQLEGEDDVMQGMVRGLAQKLMDAEVESRRRGIMLLSRGGRCVDEDVLRCRGRHARSGLHRADLGV